MDFVDDAGADPDRTPCDPPTDSDVVYWRGSLLDDGDEW
jgi:hypothetical protein